MMFRRLDFTPARAQSQVQAPDAGRASVTEFAETLVEWLQSVDYTDGLKFTVSNFSQRGDGSIAFTTNCPRVGAHGDDGIDREPSFSVTITPEGKILTHCFVCDDGAVWRAFRENILEPFLHAHPEFAGFFKNNGVTPRGEATKKKTDKGCTLAALDSLLPGLAEFLTQYGCREETFNGAHCVVFPLATGEDWARFFRNGEQPRWWKHLRIKFEGDDKWRLEDDAPAKRLLAFVDAAVDNLSRSDNKTLFLTESPLDAAVLNLAGLPAIGCVGKGNAAAFGALREIFSNLDDFQVIVWQEPDAEGFAETIAVELGRSVHKLQTSPKDALRARRMFARNEEFLRWLDEQDIEEVQPQLIDNLGEILDRIEAIFRKYVWFPSEYDGNYTILAVWCAATWFVRNMSVFPYLLVVAPDRGSGKTRVAEVASHVTNNPMLTVQPTAAVTYRLIEQHHGEITLIIDEVDKLLATDDDAEKRLYAVLNAGFKRGEKVPITDRVTGKPLLFEVFSPKILIANRGVVTQLADRSIPVFITKAPPDAMKTLDDFEFDYVRAETEIIRNSLKRLAENSELVNALERLRRGEIRIKRWDFIKNDRLWEGLRYLALLAYLADPVGLVWVRKLARAVWVATHKRVDNLGDNILILKAFQTAFADSENCQQLSDGDLFISTESLFLKWGELAETVGVPKPRNYEMLLNKYFHASEDERNHYVGCFGAWLSRHLGAFRIQSVRDEERRVRGYKQSQFEGFFNSYLSEENEPEPNWDGVGLTIVENPTSAPRRMSLRALLSRGNDGAQSVSDAGKGDVNILNNLCAPTGGERGEDLVSLIKRGRCPECLDMLELQPDDTLLCLCCGAQFEPPDKPPKPKHPNPSPTPSATPAPNSPAPSLTTLTTPATCGAQSETKQTNPQPQPNPPLNGAHERFTYIDSDGYIIFRFGDIVERVNPNELKASAKPFEEITPVKLPEINLKLPPVLVLDIEVDDTAAGDGTQNGDGVKELVENADKPILAIGFKVCADGVGKEEILINDGDEKKLLERAADFIERFACESRCEGILTGYNLTGFDLPYLIRRAERLGVKFPFRFAIDKSTGEVLMLNIAETEGLRVPKIVYCGEGFLDVVDTYWIVLRYDFTARELPSHTLKDAARHFGVEEPDRILIDYGNFTNTFKQNPEAFKAYLLADLRETFRLFEKLIPPHLAVARIVGEIVKRKVNLSLVTTKGKTVIWGLLLENAYGVEHVQRLEPDAKVTYPGGLVAARKGYFTDVAKIDVASLYPTVMMAWRVRSRKDVNAVMLRMLRAFTEERLKFKRIVKQQPENFTAKALSDGLKLLINSAYGVLGAEGFLFNDMRAAAKVTEIGRKIATLMAYAVEEAGGVVIEVDTDGIIFSHPQPERVLERLSQLLPKQISVEPEGCNMFAFVSDSKNYILVKPDGSVIVKGSKWRGRDKPRYATKFAPEFVLKKFLEGEEAALAFAREVFDAIASGDGWDWVAVTRKVGRGESDKFLKRHGFQEGEKVTFSYKNAKQKEPAFSPEEGYDIAHYTRELLKVFNELGIDAHFVDKICALQPAPQARKQYLQHTHV